MDQSYSNLNATLAIAKASFRSIMRSPSAVVFSLAFPLIFITVFANIGSSGVTVDVAVAKTCDTTNVVYNVLKKVPVVHLIKSQTTAQMATSLSRGDIAAIIDIKKNFKGEGVTIYPPLSALPAKAGPAFVLNVQYSNASAQKGDIFKSLLNNVLYQVNSFAGGMAPPAVAQVHQTTIKGREYKYIDFLLPGMLGFSLLSSGVFGTAFVFLSLRLTLVVKRFFATPVKRYSIVLGEMLARLVFSLLGALFIIMVGHYVFGFTLIHGVTTVLNMMVLATIGLIIFMGFGFIISGIAKNESSVPPISNIITMPQFLLSGTFFSASAFPVWLQYISKVLPLTYLNTAMREVAFEGAGLGDVTHQLLILGAWFIGIYAVAVKTFKWE
ncbi:ABC-2 type transport system permease protein [Mucilaginibacter gracilis]|uniref:Transport permease protein n=1 Tax=Mucilaginibacter gracilis TaxID=423350 RepID=A0A495J994_9SPHI|nr:ABC transporter permease [Mucilaginibacter gracilis]RKR85580.1 ABC-2 type transport system permease protein [Mucilaginibacter gracilis]